MEIEQTQISGEQLLLDRQLLESCRVLDIEELKRLGDKDADFWFQDPETGKGALHYVVEGCNSEHKVDTAVQCLRYLLGNGAVWNQMDKHHETAGCSARRLGRRQALYDTIVDAGVRAELLLAALDARIGNSAHSANAKARNEAFLGGKLEYTHPVDGAQTLLDEEHNAVMMSWERDIMKRSAEILVPRIGEGSVLNVGFGLGIIDTFIQERKPRRHVIIEAHPDVLVEMRRTGWYEKEGVEILEGRWQEVVDALADREVFDGVYYDPFEYWEDTREFFDAVVALTNPSGVFSFFHGLGADNQLFYDVYTKIAEMELANFGFETEWEEIEVRTSDDEWIGAKRRYWTLEKYRLPICRFMM